MTSRRRLWYLSLLLPVLIAMGVVALLVEYDDTWLTKRVLRFLDHEEIVKFEVEALGFRPLGSSYADAVTATIRLKKSELDILVPHLMIDHHLTPLLFGRPILTARLALLDNVSLSRRSIALLPEDGALPSSENARLSTSLWVRGLDVFLHDLQVDQNAQPLYVGLAGEGTFEVEELEIEEIRLTNARGNVLLQEGQLLLNDVEVTTPVGSILAVARLDLRRPQLSYTLSFEAESLDLNALVAVFLQQPPSAPRDGSAETVTGGIGIAPTNLGSGELTFQARGNLATLNTSALIEGNGVLKISGGTFSGMPLGDLPLGLDRLLQNLSYNDTELVFHLEGDRARIEPMRLWNSLAEIVVEGTIPFAKGEALQLEGNFVLPSLGAALLLRGLPRGFGRPAKGRPGWTTIAFSIEGTLGDARLRFGRQGDVVGTATVTQLP